MDFTDKQGKLLIVGIVSHKEIVNLKILICNNCNNEKIQ